MDENLNFETYLFLSSKKFIISVNNDINEKIYEKELILDKKTEDLDAAPSELTQVRNIWVFSPLFPQNERRLY